MVKPPGSLTIPTDRNILVEMMDQKRYSPKLLGLLLDQDSSYIASQLRKLEERGYVQDPVHNYNLENDERSQMYELTQLGVIVTYHIPRYIKGLHTSFEVISNYILAQQPDSEFMPDLIVLSDIDKVALRSLQDHDDMTIPSELKLEVEKQNYSPRTTHEALYTLYCHKLATRHGNLDVYKISDRGNQVLDLLDEGISSSVEITREIRKTYSEDEQDWLDQFTGER